MQLFRIARRPVIGWDPMFEFCRPKPIVCFHENLKHRPQSLDFPRETTAFSRQNGNVMPQIGIHSLNRESIVFVVYIPYISPRINHVNIAQITVSSSSPKNW